MNLPRQDRNAARARLAAAGIEHGEAGRDAEPARPPRARLGPRDDATARRTTTPTPEFVERFDALIERRARREPVAYIRGVQEFWSRDFAVNPAVLIPRPETELIIEELLALLPDRCAGAAAPRRRHRHRQRLPRGHGGRRAAATCDVIATDISRPALACGARERAARTASSIGSRFVECAYLSARPAPFDFILSNPPYVTEAEYQSLAPEVREYEPASRAGGRRGRPARHPADRRSGADAARRRAARCSSRSATSRPMRSPSW